MAERKEALAVGVCTYNSGRAIVRTLDSLVAMDRVDGRVTRIVVVDNGSTDDTAGVVERYAEDHPAVSCVREPRPGKVMAMRRLFGETDEPLVAVVDDDCVVDRGWARAMLGVFHVEHRAGVVGGVVRNAWESGPTRLARIYHRSLGDQNLGPVRRRLDGLGEFLMGASLVCRREAVEASGWLDSVVLASRTGSDLECGAEDAELCIRVRSAGWGVWYEPGAKIDHLIPASRQTGRYLARLRGAICRGEPMLRLVSGQGPEGARRFARRARLLYVKTFLFDWRPTRRRIRLAERAGRAAGWRRVVEVMEAEGG